MNIFKRVINFFRKGMFTDSLKSNQPPETHSFALNAIQELEEGGLSSEPSNFECGDIQHGGIPIGKIYIGNNENVIFFDNNIISVYDEFCNHLELVNFEDLNFQITHQIEGIYRLKNGCDKIIYWTDNLNNVYHFNINSPNDFKTNGNWDINKFKLQRQIAELPITDKVVVNNSNGRLKTGSYVVALEYLDGNMNPTEALVISDPINIWRSNLTDNYKDIEGSYISDNGEFESTTKSISVHLLSLDESFAFYRLLFVSYTSGTGQITDVKVTQPISTTNKKFIYTGENFQFVTGSEEVRLFTDKIGRAKTITQIENRLVLGNITGPKINHCKYFKVAARINADCYLQKIYINDHKIRGLKDPTVKCDYVGYMPGEMYSFGIVPLFDDNTTGRSYHIPGRNSNFPEGAVFKKDSNSFGMDSNNSIESQYVKNDNCGFDWGIDSYGEELVTVRHHRFPTRKKLNIPLVKEVSSTNITNTLYQVQFKGTGTIDTPCSQDDIDSGECSTLNIAKPFSARITYTVDGVTHYITITIIPSNYTNSSNTFDFEFDTLGNYHTSNNIVVDSIKETDLNGDYQVVTIGSTSPKGILYSNAIVLGVISQDQKIYETHILGIKFSNIHFNDSKVIGYYIVRQERTESNKSVLDSAVLVPMVNNDKYTSHGLLMPDDGADINNKYLSVISPRHKFYDVNYIDYKIEKQGDFIVTDRKFSKSRYLDVMPGTSHQENNKDDDDDGWSLKLITRDNIMRYVNTIDDTLLEADNYYYLDALESKNTDRVLYNLSGDNKISVIELKDEYLPNRDRLPYVYLRVDNSSQYSNFVLDPYYRIHKNYFTGPEAIVYGGDAYIFSLRYSNTMFWRNRIAERPVKNGIGKIILGVSLIVVGAVVAFFTLGAGLAVVGTGAKFLAAGIKRHNWAKAYQSEYDKGLRETVQDNWVNGEYNYTIYPASTPEDDEIQWATDCLTDLWFESDFDGGLRHGFVNDDSSFLHSPGLVEDGRYQLEQMVKKKKGIISVKDESLYPFSALDIYIMNKLTTFSDNRNDGREYNGHVAGELYLINDDYNIINTSKLYYHLPLEYDCCSNCEGEYLNRIRWSEKSFDEEISDSYRVMLPNNYRDIQGETGMITKIFVMGVQVFVFTKDALWMMPYSIQERLNTDIISFVGSGEFFSLPLRKIVDDEQNSAGLQHQFALLKGRGFIVFVSENQSTIYMFNGQKLDPISFLGKKEWFRENLELMTTNIYEENNIGLYPFDDNPSNKYGVGFILTIDEKEDRIIVTKKDFVSDDISIYNSPNLCISDRLLYEIPYTSIQYIDLIADGYYIEKIEDCNIHLEKEIIEEKTIILEIPTNIPNNSDVHVIYDSSGSFGSSDSDCQEAIQNAVNSWYSNIQATNPNWTGNLFEHSDSTERWLHQPEKLINDHYNGNVSQVNLVLISFINEASHPDVTKRYHLSSITNTIESTNLFISDRSGFINAHAQYKSFAGILYPIVFGPDSPECSGGSGIPGGGNLFSSRAFLQHSIAAMIGRNMTTTEISNMLPVQNGGFPNSEWATLLSSLHNGVNFPGQISLEDYGWRGKWDRYADPNLNIISSDEFASDIAELLADIVVYEEIQIVVQEVTGVIKVVVPRIPVIHDIILKNNGWTLSFSLENKAWVSFHSYIPIFYFHVYKKFSSFIADGNSFWSHENIKESYLSFYGSKEKFIVEFVNVNGLETSTWEDVLFHTKAERFIKDKDSTVDNRNVTFDNVIIYNERQSTGLIQLRPQVEQISEPYETGLWLGDNVVLIDRNEKEWSLNNFRDMRSDYDQVLFFEDITSRQSDYYIDKVLNNSSLDMNKDWMEMEMLRGSHLIVRLIYSNFEEHKLTIFYSLMTSNRSLR